MYHYKFKIYFLLLRMSLIEILDVLTVICRFLVFSDSFSFLLTINTGGKPPVGLDVDVDVDVEDDLTSASIAPPFNVDIGAYRYVRSSELSAESKAWFEYIWST